MLKVQEIRELIKLVDGSSIHEFVYEQDGTKIELKKKEAGLQAVPPVIQTETAAEKPAPAAVTSEPAPKSPVDAPAKKAPEAAKAAEETLHSITSPMVGTFYKSPSPDEDAYVKPGSKVGEEDVVCIVEAMKLFNEITAEVKGEIVEVLVEDGQLVEYGQPLFLVKPE